jgi:hypothetical protein
MNITVRDCDDDDDNVLKVDEQPGEQQRWSSPMLSAQSCHCCLNPAKSNVQLDGSEITVS